MLPYNALISTLTGPQMAGDMLGGGPTLVICWDGDRVTVGEIEVYDADSLVIPFKIELDDESFLHVCSETMILLRNGAPRFPEQLTSGTSLLPYYSKLSPKGYPVYQEPGDWHRGGLTASDKNRWRRVTRMVAEWKLERRCEKEDVVSYISKDRIDCRPDNLKLSRKKRKTTQKKVGFAEPIFEAQRFIERHNHKVDCVNLDTSRNLLSIRGLGTANFSVGGIYVSVDSE